MQAEEKRKQKLLGSLRYLSKAADKWAISLNDNYMKMSILETSMTNLDYKLSQINSYMSRSNNNEAAGNVQQPVSKEELISLEDDLANLLNQQHDLLNTLSPQNIILVESLKDRIRNLSSSQLDTETYCLPDGWERGIQDDIPYFINHGEESTQWDHPVFAELMNSLAEFNNVKFSAYRMALKLRRVQKKLRLEQLDLESAMYGFEIHGLTLDR